MKNFDNEEIKLPERIIQKREERRKKIFEPKTKEELKAEFERERTKYRAALPKDDTYVEMNIYATKLTMPDKIN
jgi:hypothetical protein